MNNKKLPVGCLIALFVLGGLLTLAYWPTYQKRNFQSWIKEQDKPIVDRLNAGFKLYKEGELGEAAVEYRYAYSLARDSDSKAFELWKDHIEKISTPRKFYKSDSNLRWESGISYFKNRMIEACYGLASSISKRIMNKYAAQIRSAAQDPKNNFTPPLSEMQPAIDAIEQGLKINTQSEKLRLLLAQIYIDTGFLQKAQKELADLLLISPNLAEAYNMLGMLYSSKNYMYSSEAPVYRQKAIAMFERAAMMLDMDGAPMAAPHFNLGMFYATPPKPLPENALPPKEDALKALTHLRKYLEIAGDNAPNALRVKATIKKLEKFDR